ncbi:hypothetical protein LOD99_8360 [Oopsacas minuta]|uniref:Alpha/beta hydrolase fold-3 domain-containing protein n=1 Tax=Oopsacas minuta TaxID=111878 RepID=A0AAV7JHE2_9METZ|nr:hypothetical protein LOD99_8360 [Oopsacas minuta]
MDPKETKPTLKSPKNQHNTTLTNIYKLTFISTLIAFISLVTLHFWIASCDLTNEHRDMTCSLKFFLYAVPHIITSMVSIANTLSYTGIVEFNTSLRYMLNQLESNTTVKYTDIQLEYPVRVQDLLIDGIVTYVYTPNTLIDTPNSPVVFYFHGGGGIMQSPKLSDYSLRQLADDMKVKIFVPNYRKSPEVCFPQPQEDCLTVVKQVVYRSNEFGVDSKRVFIMGDSFGGHAAVYVAFKWHELGLDTRHAPLRGLIPVYPRLQWINLQLDSYIPITNNGRMSSPQLIAIYLSLALIGNTELIPYILNHSIAKLSANYQERLNEFPHLIVESKWQPPTELIEKYSSYADTLLSPYATLLFQSNFSVLPPTLLITAEYDTLLSEGLLFKERLEVSGVSVEYYEGEKMFHGYFYYSGLSPCIDAYKRVARFVDKYV